MEKITGHRAEEIVSDIGGANTVEESVLTETDEESVLMNQFEQSLEQSNFGLWLNSIKAEAAETVSDSDDGDRDNIMFNPAFAKFFIDLCKLCPLWSSICCQFFNRSQPTASTSNVECHIKVMKQSMEDVIPCSVS